MSEVFANCFYGKICAVADVAQLAEHITRNNEVMGSIPIIGSIPKILLDGRIFYLENQRSIVENDNCPPDAIPWKRRRLLRFPR